MRTTTQAQGPGPNGFTTAPPGGLVIRFVQSGQTSYSQPIRTAANGAHPANTWNAWSAWPGHPAILPPVPRLSKGDAIAASSPDIAPRRTVAPARASSASTSSQAPVRARRIAVPQRATPQQHSAHAPHTTHTTHATYATRAPQPRAPRTQSLRRTDGRVPARQTRPATSHRVENLAWPASFDDWMIDIVRRRALRLNSGARRRGSPGSVRAVELAHILDRSVDETGRWQCAICREPVTLQDLSFDHVVALADGGEHAAHNLVPAHRKCNEIKGSEKAQYRAQALDRWLTEWAAPRTSTTPKAASHYPAHTPTASSERRYA
ncbi:MAG: HNH endonuclease [Ktedonobacterales bacterium]